MYSAAVRRAAVISHIYIMRGALKYKKSSRPAIILYLSPRASIYILTSCVRYGLLVCFHTRGASYRERARTLAAAESQWSIGVKAQFMALLLFAPQPAQHTFRPLSLAQRCLQEVKKVYSAALNDGPLYAYWGPSI